MTVACQDLTVYYGGTQVTATTDGNVTRKLAGIPTFSPHSTSPNGVYSAPFDCVSQQGSPVVQPMTMVLPIMLECTGSTALAIEREMTDAVRTLHQLINPFDGAQTLKITRTDHDSNSISMDVLQVRPVEVPRYSADAWMADGHTDKGRGRMLLNFVLWCPIPYFINTTATTLEYTANDPADSDTMANPGIGMCGARFEVDSITGNTRSITITNSTNGYTFEWTNGADFVDGDYIDWFYTDPTEMSHSGANLVAADGSDFFMLSEGNNTVTALADVGTVTFTAYWKPRYLSL